MGRQRRPAPPSCSCGPCSAGAHAGRAARRWRCRRSIRCPRRRIATSTTRTGTGTPPTTRCRCRPRRPGLVSLVDEQCKIGLRQRVVGGYLFYATDPTSETDADRRGRRPARRCGRRRGSAWRGRRRRWSRRWRPSSRSTSRCSASCSRTRAPRRARWRRSCDAAGSIRRRCCPSCCRACRRRRPNGRAARARWRRRSIPKLRAAALAIYLEQFGDEAPRWDVAAPTWRERSASLERLMRGTSVGAPIDDQSAGDEAAAAVRAALARETCAPSGNRASPARATGRRRRRGRRRALCAAAGPRASGAAARGRAAVDRRRARRSRRRVLAAARRRPQGRARRRVADDAERGARD